MCTRCYICLQLLSYDNNLDSFVCCGLFYIEMHERCSKMHRITQWLAQDKCKVWHSAIPSSARLGLKETESSQSVGTFPPYMFCSHEQ